LGACKILEVRFIEVTELAKLNILEYPDERLHTIAEPVDQIDESIRSFVKDMAETMYESKGIGLAATQVDVHKRIITIDLSEDQSDLLVLINPSLVSRDGEVVSQEGCLSVPAIYESVVRAETVCVEAMDLDGEKRTIDADGLLAICIQHEMDHLEGKVFVEYLSQLKRQRIIKKLEKKRKLSDG
jgi:peptide deformylase